MAPAVKQAARYVEIARACLGIDVGGGTARDAFDGGHGDSADVQLPSNPRKLLPGRQAVHVEIAAEA